MDMEGLSFSKRGFVLFELENSAPRLSENVRDLYTSTNAVGYERLGITPTTRSKRSISHHYFGRLLNVVSSPKNPAFERMWSRAAGGKDEWRRRTGSDAPY